MSEERLNTSLSGPEDPEEQLFDSEALVPVVQGDDDEDHPDKDNPMGGVKFNEKRESSKAVEFLVVEPRITTYALRKKLNDFYGRNVVNYITLRRWRRNWYPKIAPSIIKKIRKSLKINRKQQKKLEERLIKDVSDTIGYYQSMVIFLETQIIELKKEWDESKDYVTPKGGKISPVPFINSVNSLSRTIKDYQDRIFEYTKFLELEGRLNEMIREITMIILEKVLPMIPVHLRKAVVEDLKETLKDYRHRKLADFNIIERVFR